MNSSPMVSVIIPCYNQGEYLYDSVSSVLAQTYQNFEIIIINDGSTCPHTIKILHNFHQPKTVVIHTHNQGLVCSRNNGIKIARGKYILPLDADDKIGNTYLQEAVELLENNHNLGIVYSQAEFFGNKTGKWELPKYQFPHILLGNVIFCSGFFRKSDWEKVGGYNPSMIYGWEDYDFWLSLIELKRDVVCIPNVLFYYRQHSLSMTNSMTEEQILYTFNQLFKNHTSLYRENKLKILFFSTVKILKLLCKSVLYGYNSQGITLMILILKNLLRNLDIA
ncbi:glycosyltransferase family 2 protein [Anabaena sp. FACHB-1237]|nr:glycosyltransferase family 2 protein [Anabaena sp. FACHB-1237]